MKLATIKLLFLIYFLGINFSFAQFTSKGTVEMGGDFSFSFQNRSGEHEMTLTTFNFNAYFGLMVAKGFEIGIGPLVTGFNSKGFSSGRFGLYVSPGYNFTTKSNVYPYLAAIGGYGFADNGEYNANVPTLGGEGGIKVKAGESTLILIRIQYLREFINYQRETDKYNYVPADYIYNTIAFGVGFRYFIPAKEKAAISR